MVVGFGVVSDAVVLPARVAKFALLITVPSLSVPVPPAKHFDGVKDTKTIRTNNARRPVRIEKLDWFGSMEGRPFGPHRRWKSILEPV